MLPTIDFHEYLIDEECTTETPMAEIEAVVKPDRVTDDV